MNKTVLPAHQARSRETLQRLIQATEEILEKEGLPGATIPNIAARAGLSPGTVYRRFPDKDALLQEVFLRFLRRTTAFAEERLKPELWEGTPLNTMAAGMIGGMLHGYRNCPGLLRAMVHFVQRHPDSRFRKEAEELQSRAMKLMTDLLLTRRGEMHHPNPELAVPLGIMLVVFALREMFLHANIRKHWPRFLPGTEQQLNTELPQFFLRYLGVGK